MWHMFICLWNSSANFSGKSKNNNYISVPHCRLGHLNSPSEECMKTTDQRLTLHSPEFPIFGLSLWKNRRGDTGREIEWKVIRKMRFTSRCAALPNEVCSFDLQNGELCFSKPQAWQRTAPRSLLCQSSKVAGIKTHTGENKHFMFYWWVYADRRYTKSCW